MIIGILKEIKAEENRVSMVPAGVEVMVRNGHHLLVEKGAGSGSGFEDRAYLEIRAGANVIRGGVTCKGVAEAFGLPYTPIGDLLQNQTGQRDAHHNP